MSSYSESSESESTGSDYSDNSDFDEKKCQPRKNNNQPSTSSRVVQPKTKKRRTKSPVKVSKEWKKPDLTNLCLEGLALFNFEEETGSTDGPPGQYKSYISWMTCLDPSTCPFGEECFQFILGNSDQDFSSITQSMTSDSVERAFKRRKSLLPRYPIPSRPNDPSDDEESEFADYDYDDEREESDHSSNDDEPEDKNDNSKKDKKPIASCKGPLDFLLQYPNHEFRKENCLTLWTTNNKRLKITVKNFLRGAFKDMSKAKGMYPQMTPEAYGIFDSLKIALPYRKKYIIRAQKEGRLLDLQTLHKNVTIEMSQEEFDTLGTKREIVTTGPSGETVTIKIK